MLNSDAPGPLEFYKNRFDIENNLTRNILEAIPPTSSTIGRMNGLPRPVKLLGRSFGDCMCVSMWPHRAPAM
jgi:hypothetical protein